MTSGIMRALLAFASVGLVVGALLILPELNGDSRDVALVVVGVIAAKFGSVFDYYYGSSDGSKEKTAMLKPLDLSGYEQK